VDPKTDSSATTAIVQKADARSVQPRFAEVSDISVLAACEAYIDEHLGPLCTLPGGCGPKPGPAPTKPSNHPESCEDIHRTTVTERLVWCTEGFNISAISSGVLTSSTMLSSYCLTAMDATLRVCSPGPAGFDTTTTETGTYTHTSDAPACTRAPLSLDDDEGNNNPDDPLNTSSTFASNTTTVASKTRSTVSTSTATAAFPTDKPVDRNGGWKVQIWQAMNSSSTELEWTLFDPNNEQAGWNKIIDKKQLPNGWGGYIESLNRDYAHSMPFGVDFTVLEPYSSENNRVKFEIQKAIPGCHWKDETSDCKPFIETESRTEKYGFRRELCESQCEDQGRETPLKTADLFWCDDLNTADWQPVQNADDAWFRTYSCGWAGYDT
jgi:hypothetical protein